MLRIIVADDHPLVLESVRRILERNGSFEIVGTATTAPKLLALVRRTSPDVVLVDLRMPGMDGLVCLERLRLRHPDVVVVVLSASAETERIEAALRHGARAYIVKNVSPLDLASAIRQAVEGTVYHPLVVAGEEAASHAASLGITARELAILKSVSRGLSNAAIAQELWVSRQTVKFHLTNLYRKLGVTNRTQAARQAHVQGLVEADEVAAPSVAPVGGP
jgi:DNA-binding NarL/FixJ family response regulator